MGKGKTELYFAKEIMRVSDLGGEASVPDLAGGLILQNQLEFHLDEEDEIFQGYGRRKSSFPYRQFSCYDRILTERTVKTVTLENAYLKAVFLPEFGGRLWCLYDKEKSRELLYTNDVIRFSNLAVRNAWFSGGVEWNIGVIGHSPFTTAPLFVSTLEDENGTPVLRMYEYERIRGVVWQMDFWLGENDRFLNARMRIVNETDEVIPMYWWSNIAVPEHENGRIIVPARRAFTYRDGGVYKVDVPMVDGVDISRYQNIPSSVDYFFEIPQNSPKYIAHVDENGYGLLQMSTGRQQARKLFSWGHKRGADRWQGYLTENAGRYVEIQAGLPKTQYGCLPMAPHTAWEWLERYGGVELGREETALSFESLKERLTGRIAEMREFTEMEAVLSSTKRMAKTESRIVLQGSGFGALKNAERKQAGLPVLSSHLDFGAVPDAQRGWIEFLESGVFMEPDADCAPECFMTGELFMKRLEETMEQNKNNWYAHYQLGLFKFQKEKYGEAQREFELSNLCRENAWARHGAAYALFCQGRTEEAAEAMLCGMRMRKDDLSYVKDGFKLLRLCNSHAGIIALYEELPETIRTESRIRFHYADALAQTGKTDAAYDILCAGGGLVPDDVREGEASVGQLWKTLAEARGEREESVPFVFDFDAL